jgi:EAL domain-containing protein (putative c-di-GMP-specific phosphodiesterase class I)
MLGRAEFRGLSPRLTPRAGHALLFQDPFYRFERRVYAAVEEAARAASRLDADPREQLEIEQILENGTIETLFQPIFDLNSGAILGYEALARGPRDTALEMPRAMFSLSNRLGQTVRLDRVCRERALEAAAALTGPEKLFLNVLPESFAQPVDLEGGATGRRYRGRTVLEFPERCLAHDPAAGDALFESLRDRGHSLALDDVGSAFDSRKLIERLRPNYLKLDGSLVRKVDENLIKQELLAMLVALARDLGATLIAKNVETEREARVLREAGAGFGQGFLYGAPASADFGPAAAIRDH